MFRKNHIIFKILESDEIKNHKIDLTDMENFNKTRTPQVGAISKAQKAQNIFFGKKLERKLDL